MSFLLYYCRGGSKIKRCTGSITGRCQHFFFRGIYMVSIFLLPFLIAMFMSINMGGSGTSPSFSAAYGSDIIRKDVIPGLFGVFVFLGAIIAGKKVIITIGRGILPETAMNYTVTTIILLSVSISLLIANLLGIPQSTSQSTVLALAAPAIYKNILETNKLIFEIIPTWVILPVCSFFITLFIGKFIYKPLKHKKIINFKEISNHKSLKFIVIAFSCYVAFAIGSNNVANSAGPIASMLMKELNIIDNSSNQLLIMIISTLLFAPCFGIGSSIFGPKIIKTTGKEIIDYGPLGATLVSIVTASLLLVASVTRGIPTSLVQLNTASIIGLGIYKKGLKEIVKRKAIKKTLIVWLVAPLISFSISLFLTYISDILGLF